ncbi:related to plant PR-1 class of pathogen related proteins [Fusarium torulosum]|uniref:Related to plant PR-1 class of pathogen related proteins n=1 Tax=Fusarium torulosum TaxID=33205 RepID=A0AAE8M5Y6_9HYPO|nr:related to plant PR-1 class of pathogen related proteins [Fusarium torulosum]
MLLSTPNTKSSLLLALYLLTGALAAPAPGKSHDIDVEETFGFLPATSGDGLGTDPVLCIPSSDDDEDSCSLGSDSDEKRDLFSTLMTRATMSSDDKEALRLHNEARSKVKVKALVWDYKLEAAALTWARKIAKDGKMKHSESKDRSGQGENLAYAYSSSGFKNPITAGTKAWLNEKKNYKGEKIPKGNFSEYGHYTQCVWSKSTKVGIATARDSKGAWYTVARYSGPGNVVGQKPY